MRFLALRARNDKSLLLINVARHDGTYKLVRTVKPRLHITSFCLVIPSEARNLFKS